jgi:succinate dehydrogenase/fumarate reductase flavoprotein subunit
MAIGASLWGLGNQILENGDGIRTQRALGARYNYFAWDINSPLLPLVRAAGLEVKDWQNLILVNQFGQRFYDETKGDYPNGNLYNEFNPYRTGDYRNNASIDYNPTHYNFFNAAVAMNAASGPPDYAAGPIWAIFDAEAVAREQWQVTPPYVDPDGYFFSANTLVELAAAINNPYQTTPMDGAILQATVARYNTFVDTGTDVDFGKSRPQYRIQTPPFYAAWATPLVHDTRAGLRINARCQVMDMLSQVIPGLYCGGESAGGFNQHGLGRCTAQGYIAGTYAAAERPEV